MKNIENSILSINEMNKQDFIKEVKKIIGDSVQVCFCYKDTEIQLLDNENKEINMIKISPMAGIMKCLSKGTKYNDIPVKVYNVYAYAI